MEINPQSRKGSAIAYGLVILAVVSLLLASVLEFVASNIKYNAYIEAKERAFHITESGIYFYRWYLSHQIEGKTQDEIDALWEGSPSLLGVDVPFVKDYLDNNGDKIGEVEISITFPNVGNYNVVEINSTGNTSGSPGATRTIKSTLRRSIWSDFAVISDGPVCFDQYWTINGKVMGNNGVHFDGVANNIVSAGVTTYDDTNPMHTDPATSYYNAAGVWTKSTDPGNVFKAGYRTGVAKKDFTGIIAHLQSIRNRSRAGGNDSSGRNAAGDGYFFGDAGEGRQIILDADGTFDVCTVAEFVTNTGADQHSVKKYLKNTGVGTCTTCSGACLDPNLQNLAIPNFGVIFVEDNIWLEGTINGKRVSIAAASIPDPSDNANIFITNHVKYTNYDGTDVLGLLAEGDFEILKNSPDELRIDGAVLAQKGSVSKPEYNPECCGTGCVDGKNTIDIFGCVITKSGLQFSLHKESCPSLVLERTITYDNNLYLNPPPLFPADAFYYVDFWKEL